MTKGFAPSPAAEPEQALAAPGNFVMTKFCRVAVAAFLDFLCHGKGFPPEPEPALAHTLAASLDFLGHDQGFSNGGASSHTCAFPHGENSGRAEPNARAHKEAARRRLVGIAFWWRRFPV